MWHLIVGLSRACDYGGPTSHNPTTTHPQPAPTRSQGFSEALWETGRGEDGLVRVVESTAMLGCRNLYSSSQRGPVATSPSASMPPLPSSSSYMTEELSEQLGLGMLVSRAIGCPPSLSPVRPIATSTGSQHQLIIATVAVKEAHFGSDRLMTCKTRSYWVTSIACGGPGAVTRAWRTDSLTH